MMPLRVLRKAGIASDVFLFELVHRDGMPLPAFAAGAHITVLTPNGLTRRYSLCNGPTEKDHYRIAVKRDPLGLGGSVNLVDQVCEGDVLRASAPLNYFGLEPNATSYLLIAGGIGITPIFSMVRELQSRPAEFTLLYLARVPEAAAFRGALDAPDLAGRVRLHFDHGEPSNSFDLGPWLDGRREGTHLYCCGPRGLMQAVREQTRHWPAGTVHFEDFGTAEPEMTSEDRPFSVRLVRSGLTLRVPSGTSILEALRQKNFVVPSSCEAGTCGSCRTGLLSGVAEHRDYVLDEEQHQSEIMICVSRAVSPVLELNL